MEKAAPEDGHEDCSVAARSGHEKAAFEGSQVLRNRFVSPLGSSYPLLSSEEAKVARTFSSTTRAMYRTSGTCPDTSENCCPEAAVSGLPSFTSPACANATLYGRFSRCRASSKVSPL